MAGTESPGRGAGQRGRTMVVVGDRALVIPDSERDRTEHGLYLPPGVREREKVQSGYIVSVGPGYPVANPSFLDQESWSTAPKEPVKYIPLQAEVGDHAIFLKDQAVDIEVDGTKYLIVPQAAILLLLRSNPLRDLGAEP
jgi:chaperonin GroES